MANPTQTQIDKLTTNLTRWDSIVNGSSETTVSLDSHTVNTVTYYLQQLTATNPRGAWATSTAYALKDVVVQSSIVYICTLAHTSGTFSTDLSAAKWAVYQLDPTSAISLTNDFTVDTNVLHVDSTNNRVGIGTASPTNPLHIYNNTVATSGLLHIEQDGSGDADIKLSLTGGNSWTFGIDNSDNDIFKINRYTSLDTGITTFLTIEQKDFTDLDTTPQTLLETTILHRGWILHLHILNIDGDTASLTIYAGRESGVQYRFTHTGGGNCSINESSEGVFDITGLGDGRTYTLTCAIGNGSVTVKSSTTATGTTTVRYIKMLV